MPVGGSRQQEWQNGSFEATTAAAGSALLSVGAASLRLVAGTISAGYNTISSAAAAGKSVATSTGAGQDGTFSSDKKEKVLWARFDTLDLAQRTGEAAGTREVLLLGYAVGFQVWDIQQPTEVTELLSLRDATVR